MGKYLFKMVLNSVIALVLTLFLYNTYNMNKDIMNKTCYLIENHYRTMLDSCYCYIKQNLIHCVHSITVQLFWQVVHRSLFLKLHLLFVCFLYIIFCTLCE